MEELSEKVIETLIELGGAREKMKDLLRLGPCSYKPKIDAIYHWYETEAKQILEPIKSPTVQNAIEKFESLYAQSRRG